MGHGRPTKLTAELVDEICALLEEGVPIVTACASVGIDPSTYRKWRSLARKGDGNEDLSRFFTRSTSARAKGHIKLFRDVRNPKNSNARTTLELLSRVAPDEFGRSEKRDITVQAKPDTNWQDIAKGLGFSGEGDA